MVNGSLEDVLDAVKNRKAPKYWTHTNIAIMIVGIVLGMRYSHSKNLIHRDLKPGNLLIDDRYRIRICDFGSARHEDGGASLALLLGTPRYIAPELYRGMKAERNGDVFAFGLIVYEILVGKVVFDGANMEAIMRQNLEGYRPVIPDSIDKIVREMIEQCWMGEPELRPSFDDVLKMLKSCDFRFYGDVDYRQVLRFVEEVESYERR
jgi:serine/threonine protein kinase